MRILEIFLIAYIGVGVMVFTFLALVPDRDDPMPRGWWRTWAGLRTAVFVTAFWWFFVGLWLKEWR